MLNHGWCVSDAEIETARTSCSEADKRRDNNEEEEGGKKDKSGVVIEVSSRCCDVGVPLNTD
jgi:hypothetical protein